jgi:hypothetical protein
MPLKSSGGFESMGSGDHVGPLAPKDAKMELRFWHDHETGLPHIYAHGVTEKR